LEFGSFGIGLARVEVVGSIQAKFRVSIVKW
jgi:hypothetical protein